MDQLDLRTFEGQLYFLNYHAPDDVARQRHEWVNASIQQLWREIANQLPDGRGKTRALHAVNEARMSCNSCIANNGA